MIKIDNKILVDIKIYNTKEGRIVPFEIVWDDGRSFGIDKILDTQKRASLKAGGLGIRYTCRVRNKTVQLFHEDDIWFIEKS